MSRIGKLVCLLALVIVLLPACKNEQKTYVNVFDSPLLYAQTVKELNYVVMFNNFPPIIASRNYVYAAIGAYEVIALQDSNYVSLAGQLNGLTKLPAIDTAGANIQYAALLAYCKLGEAVTFPAGSMKNHLRKLDSLADASGMTKEMKLATRNLADSVAGHILKWSKQDNYAELRTAEKYTITKAEGRWVPTPPAYSQALEPHWAEVRTLVMDSSSQFMPPRPPAFDMKDKNSKFYKEVKAVKDAGDSLTNEQKHIADFWDDLGTRSIVEGHVMFTAKKFSPTGHWMNIVGIAAEKAGADFNTTVYSYAKTSIAMFDSFIQCWDEKFRSNLVRPETAINKYLDPDWTPYLQTPPFPEYTCGHSTVSSAAAEALTDIYGDGFAYTDTSELEFGIASRSFTSFRHAAEENNWARFYGGIHFHNSCIVSTASGKKVADLVNQRIKMKK